MRTLVVRDSYLALIFTQLSSYVGHTSARPFDVISLSPSSPSCVVSAVWYPRLKRSTQANTIDFLKPERDTFHHGTAITRSRPSCRRDSMPSQSNNIKSQRVYWVGRTDYPHEHKRESNPILQILLNRSALYRPLYERRNANPPAVLNLTVGRSSSKRSYTHGSSF